MSYTNDFILTQGKYNIVVTGRMQQSLKMDPEREANLKPVQIDHSIDQENQARGTRTSKISILRNTTVGNVKYLRVILDPKLTSNRQLHGIQRQAYVAFMLARHTYGDTYIQTLCIGNTQWW